MRQSGILLHPTSLPGRYGIGDLGDEAFRFAGWLEAAGQSIWQMLPLGPTGYGESPYQLYSAFAGNPLLVSLEKLVERGWLDATDLAGAPEFPNDRVDFEIVRPWKTAMLRRAFERFRPDGEFQQFRCDESAWLENFARFMALKEANGGACWTDWNNTAEPDALEVEFHCFVQFEFSRQWRALKAYAAARGIQIMGDVPIYIAQDSADVWLRPELFRFDAVAGVPPDYFSATGQLWGNPIYRWDRIAAEGFHWWIERMREALRMFDLVRMDHFRGFEAYWEVPAGDRTAENGRWVKGPGTKLFRALESALGKLPLVAENLGVITPEVEAIRNEFRLPGMAVLQFAFGTDPQAADFAPHNFVRNLVAYTGTHDNDTTMGWWLSQGGDSTRTAEDVASEKAKVLAYFDTDGSEMNWVLIRALMASVANRVLFPMQDVLGLGSEARMNTPSVAGGNWRWRMPERAGVGTARRLRDMAQLYGRLPVTRTAAPE
jgi:4-alpha-glucanotransferase